MMPGVLLRDAVQPLAKPRDISGKGAGRNKAGTRSLSLKEEDRRKPERPNAGDYLWLAGVVLGGFSMLLAGMNPEDSMVIATARGIFVAGLGLALVGPVISVIVRGRRH